MRLSECTYVLPCDVDTDLPARAAIQGPANIAVISTAALLIAGGGVSDTSLTGAATLQATAHLRTAAGPTGSGPENGLRAPTAAAAAPC